LSFDDPRSFTAEAVVHHVSGQFEDDANSLPMSNVILVDLFVAWHATPYVDLFAAVDNLFDRVYLVGRAGVDTIGQPRFVHGGIRLRVGRSTAGAGKRTRDRGAVTPRGGRATAPMITSFPSSGWRSER